MRRIRIICGDSDFLFVMRKIMWRGKRKEVVCFKCRKATECLLFMKTTLTTIVYMNRALRFIHELFCKGKQVTLHSFMQWSTASVSFLSAFLPSLLKLKVTSQQGIVREHTLHQRSSNLAPLTLVHFNSENSGS